MKAALIALLFHGVSSAYAQDEDAAAFSEELGEVHLFVFEASTSIPIPNAAVRIANVEMGRTDADGALRLDLFGGLYHVTVEVGDGIKRTAAIRAYPKQAIEIDLGASPDSDELSSKLRNRNTEPKTCALCSEPVPEVVTTQEVIIASEPYEAVEELTVTATRIEGGNTDILKEKQQTAKVTEIIGSEQMSKSGDSDAAAALKRVTGVTIVGGKYVYVRGLGDRYSSTMLNDLRLPSPDPERRVVPLDMFPSSILESMVIQKTFSPDMPGDFGGGVVNLRTKSYPSEPLFKVELQLGINPGSTFTKQELGADKGSTDFLGIDGGHRAIPKTLEDATKDQKLVTGDRFTEGYSKEEIAEISKSLPNHWATKDKRLPPDFSLSLTGGNGFKIKSTKLGFFTSLLYKNEWDSTEDRIVRDYVLANANTGELAVNNDYRFFDTLNTVTLGGVFALGVDFGHGQTLAANTLVDRITDNEFSRYTGVSADLDSNINELSWAWTERMLIVQQLKGSHLIHPKSGLKLDWRYGFSTAAQDQPDKRHTRYEYLTNDDLWVLSSGSDGNSRSYITVDDKTHDMGLDLTFPFKQWTRADASVKVGGALLLKDRAVDLRTFGYTNVDSLSLETRNLRPEQIFVDENFTPDRLALQEWTQPTDNYTGTQESFAGYLSSELPIFAGLSASGGVRFEKSIQEVKTFDVFTLDGEEIKSAVDTFDVLPALVLTYRFKNNMLVRLGYGKTLNRPDFREMSPGCVNSYAGKGDVCGAPTKMPNPAWTTGSGEDRYLPYQLNRTVIHNVDARWEWYFGETGDETLSIGGFYKEFIDPIESIMRASSQKGSILLNADGARDVGLELEFKKNFGFLHAALEDLYAAANASWIYSRIQIPNIPTLIQTSDKRPLQGQSPYVVNAQLGYDNPDLGLSTVLLYNVYGPRISDVGTNRRPDIYEQPFHQLDFVAKKSLKKGFQITLRAKNLIDLPVRFTQGEETTEKYKKGREIGLGLSWTY